MSFFRKARELSEDLAAASKRQAQRAKLEVELRRLESKVDEEKSAIGPLLFPLIEAGTLKVELPEVHDHVRRVAELQAEIAQKRGEIQELKDSDGDADELGEASARDAAPDAPPPPPPAPLG